MRTLAQFIQLAAPFWLRKKHWLNAVIFAMVISFSLAIISISVWINQWQKNFYDAIAALDGARIPSLIGHYIFYLSLIVACIACGNWLRKYLIFRWREHLTQQLQQQWLDAHRHYHLQTHDNEHAKLDNPDQRIAEDIRLLCEMSINLIKYFIMNVAKLGAFITILWQLSGSQTFTVAGQNFTVNGYLVWIALLYSLLSTGLIHLIGKPLKTLNITRQHREADYRATLLNIREHSEAIALYRGETVENQRLNQHFAHIKHNWLTLIKQEFKLEIFTASYLRISLFIPILASLPLYFSQQMSFGGMMQARGAFSNVQDGFGWFIDYYKQLIEWSAVVQRLYELQHTLNNLPSMPQNHAPIPPSASKNTPNLVPSLVLENLTIHKPQGQILLETINFSLATPQWVQLKGRSGLGKTTLLRTLAGLWPYYHGSYHIQGKTLFLPQRPYLPETTLRQLLNYPNAETAPTETLIHTLQQIGLAHLIPQLEEQKPWYRLLSGGEQQRLSLARALIQQPDILFLDESLNQLDAQSATQLLALLRKQLPHSLCIGISHQANIQQHFEHSIDLAAYDSRPLQKNQKSLKFLLSPNQNGNNDE